MDGPEASGPQYFFLIHELKNTGPHIALQRITIAMPWYWRLARFRPAGNKRNQNVRVLQCGLSIRTQEGQEMSTFILCAKI